jgi:hypothetical protein
VGRWGKVFANILIVLERNSAAFLVFSWPRQRFLTEAAIAYEKLPLLLKRAFREFRWVYRDRCSVLRQHPSLLEKTLRRRRVLVAEDRVSQALAKEGSYGVENSPEGGRGPTLNG